jgi:hypothetical protein
MADERRQSQLPVTSYQLSVTSLGSTSERDDLENRTFDIVPFTGHRNWLSGNWLLETGYWKLGTTPSL